MKDNLSWTRTEKNLLLKTKWTTENRVRSQAAVL